MITGVAVARTTTGDLAVNAERLASELSRIGLDTPDCPHTILPTTVLTEISAVG